MNTKPWVLPAVAVLGLLMMVAWMAGLFDDRIEPAARPVAGADVSDAVAAGERDLPVYESVPASIEASQATIISSRILAQINAIAVRAGETVAAGQVLVTLEERDLASRVSQAAARIEAARARLAEAARALDRAEDLAREKVVPVAELDRARANHASLAAGLASDEQALAEAQSALGYARITAPIDGRIVDRFVEPGDTAQPGVPILSLYNPMSMRVEAHVREKLSLAMQDGQRLEIRVPALDRTLMATVEERVPAGDPGSRSFLVKARLDQSNGMLPGMYAEMLVPAGHERQVLVPKDRVAQVGQLELVWVAGATGVERRLVRTARVVDDEVVVASGLSAGELVLPVRH